MEPGAFLWLLTHSSTSFIGIVLKTSNYEISLFGMRNDIEVIEAPHKIILSKSWLFFHQPISFSFLKRKEEFRGFYKIGNDLSNFTHKELGIRRFVKWVQHCKKLRDKDGSFL